MNAILYDPGAGDWQWVDEHKVMIVPENWGEAEVAAAMADPAVQGRLRSLKDIIRWSPAPVVLGD